MFMLLLSFGIFLHTVENLLTRGLGSEGGGIMREDEGLGVLRCLGLSRLCGGRGVLERTREVKGLGVNGSNYTSF